MILGGRGDRQALRDSVTAFRAALEVYTRDRDPFDWAVGEADLGETLTALGEQGDEAALHEAVADLRTAQEILTPAAYPAAARMVAAFLARTEAALARRQQH